MIVRIFQVTARKGREVDFARFFHDTAIPLMRRQPGLVTLIPGQPRPETPERFAMVMVWKDLDSLKAFVGEDWSTAHVHPDEEPIVESRQLAHYDLVEP